MVERGKIVETVCAKENKNKMKLKTKEKLIELTNLFDSACERERRAYGEYVVAKNERERMGVKLADFVDSLAVDSDDPANNNPPDQPEQQNYDLEQLKAVEEMYPGTRK